MLVAFLFKSAQLRSAHRPGVRHTTCCVLLGCGDGGPPHLLPTISPKELLSEGARPCGAR